MSPLEGFVETAFNVKVKCEAFIAYAEQWMRDNPNEPPLDCEWDRVLLAQAEGLLEAARAGNAALVVEYANRINDAAVAPRV